MRLLQGKVALVTGGAGGIGTAICTTLAREGALVVVGYNRSEEAAQLLVQTLEKSDGSHLALRVPVTDSKALVPKSQSCTGAVIFWSIVMAQHVLLHTLNWMHLMTACLTR